MKNLLIGIFSVLFIGGIAHQVFPWWSIVVVAGLVGAFLNSSPGSSFLYGFIGVALLWGITAYRLDAGNEGILSARMEESLGGLGSMGLLVTTTLLGGLLGGMGALTGSLGRRLFK